MNPFKGMYHESRDTLLIKGCIITLPMYHDFTINVVVPKSYKVFISFIQLQEKIDS